MGRVREIRIERIDLINNHFQSTQGYVSYFLQFSTKGSIFIFTCSRGELQFLKIICLVDDLLANLVTS